MITTSYVNSQAYKEVIEDRHPILIMSANDIAQVLRNNSINSSNIDEYLDSLDDHRAQQMKRLKAYAKSFSEIK